MSRLNIKSLTNEELVSRLIAALPETDEREEAEADYYRRKLAVAKWRTSTG